MGSVQAVYSSKTPSVNSVTPHTSMSTYTRRTFDINVLKDAVKNVLSWRALAVRLGIPTNSSYVYGHVRPLCNQYGIDYSHFTGQGHNKNKSPKGHGRDIQLYLSNEITITSNHLKKRLINAGIKKRQCEVCLLTEWNGKALPIELHHLDGNSANNTLSNLQIICPNCHAQTVNFCGKNITGATPRLVHRQVTNEELMKEIPLWSNPTQVIRAMGLCIAKEYYLKIKNVIQNNPEISFRKHHQPKKRRQTKTSPSSDVKQNPQFRRRKAIRPSKEELEKLIWTKPIKQLAKDFGVTDNPIRKWCGSYGITNLPPQRYWPRRRAGWSHEKALEPIPPKRPIKRFTDQQIIEILGALEKPRWGLIRDLAKKYNTHNSVILNIRDGKSYKHIPRKAIPIEAVSASSDST
jgi:hypothetical protein